jgi:hypothetical protein
MFTEKFIDGKREDEEEKRNIFFDDITGLWYNNKKRIIHQSAAQTVKV